MGWGMYTDSFTKPPWKGIIEAFPIDGAKGFERANELLFLKIENKSFELSQFTHLEKQHEALNPLRWRHYIVYWSALSAAKSTIGDRKCIVEMGTCDGLTAYFAMTALSDLGVDYKCFLYDAWEAMKGDHLYEGEKSKEGMYGYLDISTTKRNLGDFSNNTFYKKGYIPDTLNTSPSPELIDWLHIDLNSASPTLSSLEYFFPIMKRGGVFLLDDYASHDHEDTKRVVDSFFFNKNVNLLQLPTGQAIVFKL